MELLTAFEDHMKELERVDTAAKKQERRRAERKNREKYLAQLRQLFEARLVNQRTRWRDLVNGFDPALVTGSVAKLDDGANAALVSVVKTGFMRDPAYLDLVGQTGSTPLEFFEDLVREEKDRLKEHKSGFKQLVK